MKVNSVLPLFALAVAGSVPMGLAQSPGTFTPTGYLNAPRHFHTATLLTNGKVLIAGGTIAGGPRVWASAELYDPSTQTFTVTGDMTTPRFQHTATLLPDGKVLITGGWRDVAGPPPSALHSAELYDPTTATFTAVGDMTMGRAWHTATLLNNGKVLIAGGDFADIRTRGAELYDPATGTFTSTGDMKEPGAETATLLPNGRVLIIKGKFLGPNHAELYDPATGAFTRTGDLSLAGFHPTAVLLPTGKALVAGGSFGDLGGSDGAEIYDATTGAFNATGNMTASIDAGLASALLPDGKVIIAGRSYRGCDFDLRVCAGAAELYDPVTGTFSALSNSQSAEGHAATLLPDGTVLLSGGWVCCGATIATAEIYHPAVLVPSPVLFSLSSDGRGAGAILHASTHEVVSSSNPAIAGEPLEIYGTGLIDGNVIPPQVAIGGRMAEVLFFGKAPEFEGLNQVNVRVPNGVAPGPAVSVRMNYLGRPSNEVTIAVR